MNINIRKPKRDEYNEVTDVINSRIERERVLFSKEEYEENFPPETIKDLIEGEKRRNYAVATIEDKIIGFVSYYLKENKVLWISDLVVLLEYQKKGVGSKLTDFIEQEAKNMKAEAIALETQKTFDWAVSFYENRGYKTLSSDDLNKKPFVGTLGKEPKDNTHIFGKIFK
jgi:ribosomal protein S18 acetylase RimI-like enzyme